MDPDAPITLPPTLEQDPGADILSTYWPMAIFFVLALACVAGAIYLSRRRKKRGQQKRHWARTTLSTLGWSGLVALFLAVGLAFGVNTWVGYFPSVATLQRWVDDKTRPPVVQKPKEAVTGSGAQAETLPGTDPEHRVTTDSRGYAFLTSVPATEKGMKTTGAWVYLPPGYDAPGNTERYSVIYTLHGAPGSAADWFAGGRIDYLLDELANTGTLRKAIVVAPDLNTSAERIDGEPLNLPDGPQIEDFVVKNVVGWADSNLRTIADPEHRVISGMSAGGLGSLVYGLHHPDVFGGVVSLMPYTKPYTKAIKNDPTALRLNSPLDIIADRKTATTQKIFLGQGDGERTDQATQISDALKAQGQPTTLRIFPGLAHNWTSARTMMPYGLVWVATQEGLLPKS